MRGGKVNDSMDSDDDDDDDIDDDEDGEFGFNMAGGQRIKEFGNDH